MQTAECLNVSQATDQVRPMQNPELPETAYLNTPAAAHHVNLSPSKLNKMRMGDDGPPFVKIGRRSVRYRRDDLDRWMASQLVTQKNPPEAV